MAAYSTVLIAAGEGCLRDALTAMMVSMPDVKILEAGDTEQAKGILCEHRPDLVIIDSALPGNHAMELVLTVHRLRPRVQCCILVDDVGQQAAAWRAGAACAPLKGVPPAQLFAEVEQLLFTSSRREDTPANQPSRVTLAG